MMKEHPTMATEADDDRPKDLGHSLGLWPTRAIEGAMADRDRLADVIDRARERLAHGISRPNLLDEATSALQYISKLSEMCAVDDAVSAIYAALKILAEAEPEDPESPGRPEVGGS
jgi:hypothetical protein